jgi:hypothetical protein
MSINSNVLNSRLQYVHCCVVCCREIQAATGEWMNEYVRRPSRRRDNRVYVPAADLIKRRIRRSWTISSECSDHGFGLNQSHL